jgi:5-methylcytosine-specific restriction endonuclease McrA
MAGLTGRPWRRLQAHVYATETHCWICGTHVDQTLPPNHPYARSVDHVHPKGQGGPPLDRANLRLSHRRCNTRRENLLRKTRGNGPVTSHRW